jgi:FixJ family two-component response regulator
MSEVVTSNSAMADSVVFIVDDDAAMRDALEVLLKSTGLGTHSFSSADKFLKWYDGKQSGCLILDVRMPGLDGLELQAKLASDKAALPIIFLTGYGEVPTAAKAFKQGAVDFLEKPFQESALLDAIQRALQADRIRRERHARVKAYQAFLDSLSARERQVMDRVVSGMTVKSIAAELGVSKQAIDAQRRRLFRKSGVNNVAAFVQMVVSAQALLDGADTAIGENHAQQPRD